MADAADGVGHIVQTLRGWIDLDLVERLLAGGLIGDIDVEGTGLDRKRWIGVGKRRRDAADAAQPRQGCERAIETEAGRLDAVHSLHQTLGQRIEALLVAGQGLIVHLEQGPDLASRDAHRLLAARGRHNCVVGLIHGELHIGALSASDKWHTTHQHGRLPERLLNGLYIRETGQLIDELIALIAFIVGREPTASELPISPFRIAICPDSEFT